MRLRLDLRTKLALASSVLLALPWAGYRYVADLEGYLLESQQQALLTTARAVATALHERPMLMRLSTPLRQPPAAESPATARPAEDGAPVAPVETAQPMPVEPPRVMLRASGQDARVVGDREVEALLQGAERANVRLWVVNRDLKVLGVAGSLKPPRAPAEEPGPWRRWLAWIIPPPPAEFDDAFDAPRLAAGAEVAAALLGGGATRVRTSADGKAVVASAAHPVWAGDNVVGAVVAEATTHSILAVRNEALEKLLVLAVTALSGVSVVLLGFATRLSARIRRLRDEAEGAVDAKGRIGTLTTASAAGDEIGDLSRSFSTVLTRLAQHHDYLESLASRLSHELRTPVAVVRSSLENLRLQGVPDDARVYVDRAEEGIGRLSKILSRMAEATRMEASLAATEAERYDLAAVLRDCVAGYRLAYGSHRFALRVPAEPARVAGAPDLAAQMLDKLVGNAVDFSVPGETIEIDLAAGTGPAGMTWCLTVSNPGPPLPEAMAGKLFHSMVSVRQGGATATEPHLGLGLYVARLIAEFHGGTIGADNRPTGDGVAVTVELPEA